ncbi:MAG: hypothetical protein HYV95_06660 [Opitutae bacterium]|nr:hypothetical protein [Opitutae bacterium]
MSFKLTNRSALKSAEWLITTASIPWREAKGAPRAELKIQQFDLISHLNLDLIGQHIQDALLCIVDDVGESPSMNARVSSDGQMAVAIHRALEGLTWREATEPDFWAYLTCVACPQYTRWRWQTQKPSALWTRYAGNIRRNAISRLWWWAEITCDHAKPAGDPKRYTVTKNISGRQTLMLWFIDCAFSGNPLIAQELTSIQEMQKLNDTAQKTICRTMNRLARVTCLDSVSTSIESRTLCERAHKVSQLLQA